MQGNLQAFKRRRRGRLNVGRGMVVAAQKRVTIVLKRAKQGIASLVMYTSSCWYSSVRQCGARPTTCLQDAGVPTSGQKPGVIGLWHGELSKPEWWGWVSQGPACYHASSTPAGPEGPAGFWYKARCASCEAREAIALWQVSFMRARLWQLPVAEAAVVRGTTGLSIPCQRVMVEVSCQNCSPIQSSRAVVRRMCAKHNQTTKQHTHRVHTHHWIRITPDRSRSPSGPPQKARPPPPSAPLFGQQQ